MEEIRGRLFSAVFAVAFVVALGTFGYHLLGAGDWSMADCLYMTVITLTTVGYGETLPGFDQVEHARTFTILLLFLGTGTVVYFVSIVTAVIIEGDLKRALRHTRMRKQIGKLEDHVIVCGAGSTGRHAIEELIEYDLPVVAIDTDKERLDELHERFGDRLSFLVGDATDDDVLAAAGIERARGLVVATPDDKDNLYVVVSARQSNPRARIVARGSDLSVLDKLRRAGADNVVSPNYIGGLRMVSEMLRPAVVKFLDDMRRDKARVRIEEVVIPDGSPMAGQTLGESPIRKVGDVLVLAVQVPGAEGYTYNPNAEFALAAGMTLVVLGPLRDVEDLRARVRVS